MKSKFWGYRTAERMGAPQFVMLANANGSSSCRLFDAHSGTLVSYDTSGGSGTYDVAYGGIFRDCQEIVPPPSVRTSELVSGLPRHHLVFLQEQVGIESSPDLRAPAPTGRGMLAGTRELIDVALGLDVTFDTVTAARRLSESPISLDAAALLNRLYEQILRNWDHSECRSVHLWESIAKTGIAARNVSPEKTLEKAIVEWAPGWFNQLPAASGLLIGVEEKHMNVDLGHFEAPGHLELIELKAGPHADTPLKGAFEIAGYALLYCFARAHSVQLALPRGNRVLDARRVGLKAPAPREAYAGYRLKWLQTSSGCRLSTVLHATVYRCIGNEFPFFHSFPENFQWPGTPEYKLPEVLEFSNSRGVAMSGLSGARRLAPSGVVGSAQPARSGPGHPES